MPATAQWTSFTATSSLTCGCRPPPRVIYSHRFEADQKLQTDAQFARKSTKRSGKGAGRGGNLNQYDDLFFDYVDSGAIRSAKIFTKLLQPEIQANSLLDAGCGRGGWTSCWKSAGMATVLGIDGDYVDRSRMYIGPHEFQVVDLNQPFRLGSRFDLVQSLEVAEHLLPEASHWFVESLVAHGDVILFSAAVPGQGGTRHINERPIQFWRSLFALHGYRSYDFVRPLTRTNAEVEPWYRYNSILYANEKGAQRISEAVRRTEIPAESPVPEMASPAWWIRRELLKHMPCALVDKFAMINARLRVGLNQKR